MSESIRQNNLFAAEDWKVVYNAFRNVNLQAYDFQSIYESLVAYLQSNNPEEYNDYIRHSEMIAHINMIAYLGQSLAFRIDLNARENFFDTAERRESVIKLAKALTYKTKRNRTANGLCKIASIQTTQPIVDNEGSSLANRKILWNQPSDPSWYDNFIKILNASFSSTNLFGEPVKKDTISGINTELYAIEKSPNTNVVFSFNELVNGTNYTFESISSMIEDNQVKESVPNPLSPFNLVYKNDGNGNTSKDTGFFVQFKQGTLQYRDFNYTNPKVDRTERINVDNINETDVWVQHINENGEVLDTWTQVPSLVGQNIVYNDLFLKNRNIYAVQPANNNQIDIQYSDGNFGDVPVGTFRVWYRTSVNESYIIRPNDIYNKSIVIPYVGTDNQNYQLTLTFSVLDTVQNAEAEETIEDIKKNAPLVHYTQDRMINSEDYNVFPITQTNIVRKVKTVNRTHAGHSRYVDITDPTGSHSNVTVLGEDGYLYKEYKTTEVGEQLKNNTNYDALVYGIIEELISNYDFNNFYYHNYRRQLIDDPANETGGQGSDFLKYEKGKYFWNALPDNQYSTTGYISLYNSNESVELGNTTSDKETKLLRANTKVKFTDGVDYEWVTISEITSYGLVNEDYMPTGPVRISSAIKEGWYIEEVIPSIRQYFTDDEQNEFRTELENNRSFGIRYDVINDEWILITQDNIANTTNVFDFIEPTLPSQADNRWLVKAMISTNEKGKLYTFICRGTRFVFGSNKQVRFFFKNTDTIIDLNTGKYLQDNISILKSNLSHNESLEEDYDVIYKLKFASYNSDTIDVTPFIIDDNSIETVNGDIGHTKVSLIVSDLDENNIITNKRKLKIGYGETQLSYNTDEDNYSLVLPASFNDRKIKVEFVTFNSAYNTSLDRPYAFSFTDSFIQSDGTVDYAKVLVAPLDGDLDGVPDYPLSYEQIVSDNDIIFFETYNDYDNNTYERVSNTVSILNNVNYIEEDKIYYALNDITIADVNSNDIEYVKGSFYKGVSDINDISQNKASILTNNTDQSDGTIYSVYNGRTFKDGDPLLFQWQHYASNTDRIDPSISNIMDMYVLTKAYDTSVRTWLKNRLSIDEFPSPPTTDEIRNNISSIESNKSTSDQIIYIPASYKILFGSTAKSEYQAKFKVIKLAGSTLTDNEIKSEVIDAINTFFDLDNWDFGEGFYFTELGAYIHKQLAGNIASVVIVPTFETSKFGDLFEIKAQPYELFLSTATVDNVEILTTYTDFNLKKS